MNIRPYFIALAAGSLAAVAPAEITLPAVISDHMVLQREASVPIWGWAAAGEEVTATIAGKTQTTKADADGKWQVKFADLQAGGPVELTIKGENTVTIKDVLVGEVWLGSGQSNMAMTVNRAKDYSAEQAAAKLPQIRMFKESSQSAETAQTKGAGTWVTCTPESVGTFSATAYFFGKNLHEKLKLPVGLINSSVGGTPIEAWISPEAQGTSAVLREALETQKKVEATVDVEAVKAKYEEDLAKWKADAAAAKATKRRAPRPPVNPLDVRRRKGGGGGLFNGKIAPLIPYAIRGVIWYQGEANSSPIKAPLYQVQLPLLIKDWRTRWGYEFPFAWVQLPNYTSRGDGWNLVQEAMLKTLSVSKTGMAITVDVGEAKNIHPANKQAVGQRLAMWALGSVYGQKVAVSGPLPDKHEIRGNEIVLSFKHTDGGLVAKGSTLNSFVISGEDKQWHEATARIEGDKVIVSSPDVAAPVAARYAWKDNPEATLFNGAGIPASPFRTDDWPLNLSLPAVRKAPASATNSATPDAAAK